MANNMTEFLNELFEIVSPDPRGGDQDMKLWLPTKGGRIPYENYDYIVRFIEFQRRCSNQQFDNMLEQLRMCREALFEPKEAVENGVEVEHDRD